MNQADIALISTLVFTGSTIKNKLYNFPQPHKLICKMGTGPVLWTALWIKLI